MSIVPHMLMDLRHNIACMGGRMEYNIAIIGGGPAGLSAAVYALRAGHSVVIIEGNACGGQMLLAHEIENYPGFKSISGVELADAMSEQAGMLGAAFLYKKVKSIEKTGERFAVTAGKETVLCKAVIVASGTERRKLGVPNEDMLVGSGISYCAVCDGRFYQNKDVAVIGGGNTALGDALYLAGICASVTLIHRRDSFRADRILVERIRNTPNIRVLTSMRVASVQGEFAVKVLELVSTDPDKLSERMILETGGVFVAVGSVSGTQFLGKYGQVICDESGYIRTDERCRTSVAGLFAAGDVRLKTLRQISTAVSDGSVAGVEAAEYVDSLHI